MKATTIIKIADYINSIFTYPRREYEEPQGTTHYVPRKIEQLPEPKAQTRPTEMPSL